MNVGIIGAGGIAHKLHLPEIAAMPDMRVTHVAGRKPDRLKLLSKRFDVPNWTTDYRSLLSEPSIDGVIIALPHPLHVRAGLEALAAGKHILMQKPLCADVNEANRFVDASERSDRIVYVLPNLGREVAACRTAIAEGAIGKVSGAHCRVSHGGPEVYYAEIRDLFEETGGDDLWFFRSDEAAVGALFDMGVYAVSALVGALGSVLNVMGRVATLDKPTTLDDTATLILEFENGALATAETGWCDPARTWQLRIHGTRGKLQSPGVNGMALTRWDPGSYTREDEPAVPHDVPLPETTLNAHEDWLACIRGNVQPELSNVHTARHVTEILLAGLESSRTGRRVDIKSRVASPEMYSRPT